MPHRYKVREIAQQSGLSEATVDRLPNWPPGVRENTQGRGHAGHRRPGQAALPSWAWPAVRYLIDVVMRTPQRFSDAFRAPVEAELRVFAPAMVPALSSVGTRRRRWCRSDGRTSDEPVARALVAGRVDHAVPHGVSR